MAVADILLTPAKIFVAPIATAAPADTVEYNADWGGAWADCGYTTSPLTVAFGRETYEVFVEQLSLAVKEMVTKETCTFETTLAEFTGDNLKLAFNSATVTTTAPGAGQPGKEEIEVGGAVAIARYAFGFEGLYQDAAGANFPVRLIVFIGEPVLNGQLQFGKNKEAGLPLQVKAKADTSKAVGKQLMKIIKITAAATV